MMQKHQESTKSNLIIDNWEYLDNFLAKFLEEEFIDKSKAKKGLFSVEEKQSQTPVLATIREKLWLYYYKEHFKNK